MRTVVFAVPDFEADALVTVYDSGAVTLAFRPFAGSWTWGPPLLPKDDSSPSADIKRCPLCGAELVKAWNSAKRCPQPPAGCGAYIRAGMETSR